MSEAREYQHIGQRTIRPDGFDKVTGKANYGADLSLPGMIWGAILRSPHAHAKITALDVSQAEAHPDVFAVATYQDFPSVNAEALAAGTARKDLVDTAANVLADTKVLYHGHAIAAVAARTEAAAEAALDLITVVYDVMDPVLTIDAAIKDGAPVLHDDMMTQGLAEPASVASNIAARMELKKGDVAVGFADADVIVERAYETPTVHQGYIEPHATTVRFDDNGPSMIWCPTQGHFDVRARVAQLLNMELGQIKVVASEIGGGFGGKTTVYLEPVALILSKKSGRPVKMTMSREDVFRASGPASASQSTVKIGAKSDGTITAMQASLHYEAGAFKGSPMGPGCMTIFTPYDVENMYVEGFDVVVNKPKAAAYRAPGAPQAEFAAEMAVNELASKLGMDPIDLRLKNAAKEGTQTIYGPKLKTVGLEACLLAAKSSPHYQSALKDNAGRGLAAGFWFNIGGQSSVMIHLNPDGTGSIIEGSPDIGGSRASMQMMAAEVLGVAPATLNPIVADTEHVAYNQTTGGSRTTFATGMAVIEAAEDIIEQLKARAAELWNVTPEQVDYQNGIALNLSSDDHLSLAEICAKAEKTGGQITGRANINARGAGPSFAVHLCDIEVDPETGKTDVLRYTAIQDAGKAIHPSYVEGQFQGGAVQGIGWALNEEYVYSADGVMENAGFFRLSNPLGVGFCPRLKRLLSKFPTAFTPLGFVGWAKPGLCRLWRPWAPQSAKLLGCL